MQPSSRRKTRRVLLLLPMLLAVAGRRDADDAFERLYEVRVVVEACFQRDVCQELVRRLEKRAGCIDARLDDILRRRGFRLAAEYARELRL